MVTFDVLISDIPIIVVKLLQPLNAFNKLVNSTDDTLVRSIVLILTPFWNKLPKFEIEIYLGLSDVLPDVVLYFETFLTSVIKELIPQ